MPGTSQHPYRHRMFAVVRGIRCQAPSPAFERTRAEGPQRPHAQHDTVARMSGETPRTETDAQPLPQGLPRRNRSASPAPRLRTETAETAEAAEAVGENNDAEDTLRPDALARAMVAIQRGSLRARLAGPDDTWGPAPAPTDGRSPGARRPGADPGADRP